MRRPRRLAALGGGLLAAGLVIAPITGSLPTPSASAAGTVVLDVDFEDGSYAPLEPSGGPALAVVDVEGTKALQVSEREASWDTVDTGPGVLVPGATHSFSMKVRLAEGETGTTTAHFTVAPSWTWVPMPPTGGVTADDWTLVTGTFTAPADADPAQLKASIEVDPIEEGVYPSFVVDDVRITATVPEDDGDDVVFEQDFETGYAPFFANDAEVTLVADDASDGAQAVQVSGRSADWNGLYLDLLGAVGLTPGTYQISAKVKLAAGRPATTGINVTVNQEPAADSTDQYKLVGEYQKPVGTDEWVEVGGTYVLTASRTSAYLYFSVQPQDGAHPAYLVDDVVIRGTGSSGDDEWTPDLDGFEPGGAVSPTVTPVAAARGTGNVAALTFDDGPAVDTPELLDFLEENDITATFCVIGSQVRAYPDTLRRIVEDGHALCNHSDGWTGLGSASRSAIEASMKATLESIRDVLGDPDYPVPYFRAPNGDWGGDNRVAQVAVALGMQPLAVTNLINDWETQDEAALTANLRNAFTPGQLVLVHDGGGVSPDFRQGSIAATKTVVAEKLAEGWTFTFPAGGLDGDTVPPADPTVELHRSDFEDGTEPWGPRGDDVELGTSSVAHDGSASLLVTGRSDTWHGPALPVGSIITSGDYEVEAWVRLVDGEGSAELNLGMEQPGASNEYPWVGGRVTVTDSAWTRLSGTYSVLPATPPTLLYVESTSADVEFLVDDVVIRGLPADDDEPEDYVPYSAHFDFEDGTLQGWSARADSWGDPHVDVTQTEARGQWAALVTDRKSQGSGIQRSFTANFQTGITYTITAYVKVAAGYEPDEIVLSAATTNNGTTQYTNVGAFANVGADEWTKIEVEYTMPRAQSVSLYFETKWIGAEVQGSTTPFLVDDITIESNAPATVEDLPSLHELYTDEFPVGVAIDQNETVGTPAQLVTKHFNQISSENYMKVENWYSAPWTFRVHPDTEALMDFAVDNDLRVYGHVLVWHSQTPDWFFQDEDGEFLTDSEADKAIMRDRLRTHINNVADALSAWGDYGDDNPLVAWDVVNEVIHDGRDYADGMRRSHWYRILGEEFVDLAFEYADEAFNHGAHTAPGGDRIELFINDYNTEQPGKQDRYRALVERLLARDVPIDGVGHQFHVNLSVPARSLEAAIARFADLPLKQAVTELDVTVGRNVDEAVLVEQGYYYKEAFSGFRRHADKLFSVTVWGLHDGRSWRGEEAPLLFDGKLKAKPAWYGAAGASDADDDVVPELPAKILRGNVFKASVALDSSATTSPVWARLPLFAIDERPTFTLRWAPDHLTVYATVADATVDAGDGIELEWDGRSAWVGRDGSGDVDAVTTEVAGGWTVVAHLPVDVREGDTVAFDIRVSDDGDVLGWNTPGSTGVLTLVEEVSFTKVSEAATAPQVDGVVDDVWADARTFTTGKVVSGAADGASAVVRTLWKDDTLYVLAQVADAQLDASASAPHEQDSVEIFLDPGNYKFGSYRYDDAQIRVNHLNQVTFGTGDEAFHAARVRSATSTTDDGYLVEVAIGLLDKGGAGTFHGLDVQVNDATAGTRTSARSWADPTGLSWQTPLRWGVAQLVAGVAEPDPDDPSQPGDGGTDPGDGGTDPGDGGSTPGGGTDPGDGGSTPGGGGSTPGDGSDEGRPRVAVSMSDVRAGDTIELVLTGFEPGDEIDVVLGARLRDVGPGSSVSGASADGSILLATAVADATGTARATVTIPSDLRPGVYPLQAILDDQVVASTLITVRGAAGGQDSLARTGAEVGGLAALAAVLIASGAALVVRRRSVHGRHVA